MSRVKNITFLKAFLFENSLPPIYNKVGMGGDCFIETANNSKFTKNAQVLKIKDVPDYLDIELVNSSPKTIVNKVKTINGHLIELKPYQNIVDYLAYNFSAKSRSNLRRYKNRLETCFNIKYICYFGDITKQEYDRLFVVLKDLLIRRFNEKQESNYELQHLDGFHNIVYNLILNKKASLFVIYDDNKPISIRINLHKKQITYYMISGYDIDYSKFHLGTLDMVKNIEWSIDNNFEIYDLLKGYDYYKTKWATKSHYYYNHIAYNYNRIGTLLIGIYIY